MTCDRGTLNRYASVVRLVRKLLKYHVLKYSTCDAGFLNNVNIGKPYK